jgi:sugar phosphate isomerase/epimerase
VQQIGEHLARWSGWAKEYGVDIALEPLRFEETNLLNTVAESGALVEQVAVSGAKLLADTYHMACNGEAPTDILLWSTLLAHVHVAEKRDRAAPGHYGEDLRPYFRALHQAGYDQRISIECNWQDFAGEVALAVATIREQWNTSGERQPL